MITKHCDGLWTVTHAFLALGVPLTTRMTLAKVSNTEWAAISPVPLSDESIQSINSVAQVRYLIAPNNYHHLFINDAKSYWPDARLFVPQSLIAKRPDLESANIITADEQFPWSADLQTFPVHGSRMIEEFLFYHSSSKTLVITDLCFNMQHPKGIRQTFFTLMTGTKGELKTSRMIKLLFGDKNAMRESVNNALAMPFERLIVAHGNIVESEAAQRLRAAMSWLI